MLSPMETNIENKRHTLAHLLASAVLELYPNTKNTIGPAIDNGFYYDFEFTSAITDSDLEKIEKKMKDNLPAWEKFSHEEKTKEEAEKYFALNPYKLELINEIVDKGEKITFYTCGNFTDLCRGGHTENPAKEIESDSFKLSRIAGAYWRGDEKNKMLTRIYGLAFNTNEELEAYEVQQEEARKRDHKKIGKELGLFVFSELVGAGLPMWTPKGTVLREILGDYVWQLRKPLGYQKVTIPHITKKDLYEKSGHWAKYADDLFKIETREKHIYAMKPMNCPHHGQIFDSTQRSYRDMPQRYCETTMVYRDEQSGELSGLSRVLSITQDDAHVFCREIQVEDEVSNVWDIIQTFYKSFNFDLKIRLSRRDPKKPEKYMGDAVVWDKAEKTLKDFIEKKNVDWLDGPGEAAFYGPKLDFMAYDSLGREWQVATIQLDFVQPENFNLYCINESGAKEQVVMIHCAMTGSIERLISILIEHFAGAFPLWLSPVQVKIVPIGENEIEYAKRFASLLSENDIRFEIDESNESLGKKIRNAKMEKVPYVAVIGKKEVESERVTLEGRTEKFDLSLEETISKLTKEIKEKTL